MTYRNLLLRQKAEITTDATERARLLSESDAWFNRALEVRAQNRTNTVAAVPGVGAAPPPPPPPSVLHGADDRHGEFRFAVGAVKIGSRWPGTDFTN